MFFSGTVRWFDLAAGFGMITPDATGPDVFVELGDVVGNGLRALKRRDRVTYKTGERPRGLCAVSVRRF